jgi:hypothetical protein
MLVGCFFMSAGVASISCLNSRAFRALPGSVTEGYSYQGCRCRPARFASLTSAASRRGEIPLIMASRCTQGSRLWAKLPRRERSTSCQRHRRARVAPDTAPGRIIGHRPEKEVGTSPTPTVPRFFMALRSLLLQHDASCHQRLGAAVDVFNGTALSPYREPAIGDGSQYLNPGWGNREQQWYTNKTANALVADGVLSVRAVHEPGFALPYSSSRLKTYQRFEFTYGLVELRARMPAAVGGWAAAWLLPTGPSPSPGHGDFGYWPDSGEIDLLEYVGSEQCSFQIMYRRRSSVGSLLALLSTSKQLPTDAKL